VCDIGHDSTIPTVPPTQNFHVYPPRLFQMQISFSDMVIPIEILAVLCSFEIITSTDASNSLEKLSHDTHSQYVQD